MMEGQAQEGLQVLVAEDNVINQKLAVASLEKMGHRVVLVANGKAAVAEVERTRFDVVLMDVQMPEMDGFEATRLIREWERQWGTHLPIIAMTAHAMTGDRERCLEAGMDDYVPKPVSRKRLESALARYAAKTS
jgi:CheY-like chemotaxis protein